VPLKKGEDSIRLRFGEEEGLGIIRCRVQLQVLGFFSERPAAKKGRRSCSEGEDANERFQNSKVESGKKGGEIRAMGETDESYRVS